MASIVNNHPAHLTAIKLKSSYTALSKSTERLSSGLRINSADDDAAGLSIRELMRSDIAALQQGTRNANDAISLLQVADATLGVIDEKLVRMKELAEQAATGTYDSTQRLVINSEFQQVAAEIDRMARATDFNGIKLLDGSLSHSHDGAALDASGAMKIHFGSGNDSAEDYYSINIGDCSTKGLGLHVPVHEADRELPKTENRALSEQNPNPVNVTLNDCPGAYEAIRMPITGLSTMQDLFQNGLWSGGMSSTGGACFNFMFVIPAGTRNIVINANGAATEIGPTAGGHNDIQLFTTAGKHLAGTSMDDIAWAQNGSSLASNATRLPFSPADYDGSLLNTGPVDYDGNPAHLEISIYNGMKIGYTGDGDRFDSFPNDGNSQDWPDYQTLAIDEAKEDLVFMYPGIASGYIKVYWNISDEEFSAFMAPANHPGNKPATDDDSVLLSIETQEKAQKALAYIYEAMIKKDGIRAHLGALQNRLENTVSTLSLQEINLQISESRISDADIAIEMTNFVRNQVLTQLSVAILGQANSFPQMLMRLL